MRDKCSTLQHMRQAYKYSILLLLLSSCQWKLTPKNAPDRQFQIATRFPFILAEAAARFIPAKPPVYIKGDTDTIVEVQILTDSVRVVCPPNLKDTLIVRIPGSTITRTVTINRTDTMEVYNTYEITNLTEKLRAAQNQNTLDAGRITDLKKDRNWWKWAAIITWILLALYIGLRIAKPKLL